MNDYILSVASELWPDYDWTVVNDGPVALLCYTTKCGLQVEYERHFNFYIANGKILVRRLYSEFEWFSANIGDHDDVVLTFMAAHNGRRSG
jgi:hypothetical protein